MTNIGKINNFDKKCLKLAIRAAKDTFENGNYPVGAVLAINDIIIGVSGNKINKQKSFVYHAENSLLIRYGEELAKVREDLGKVVSLYSTLEPCIQCLGSAVTNHVDRIIFIQKDPNGGACNIKHNNIGLWYREFWPQIIYAPISKSPKQLMIKFFKKEIEKGNKEWPERMLTLI